MKQSRRGKSEEGGFALLMVFVLAAVIAITLYMEMPRVAFESQRTKEQLLVDRGEQYKRAIQVFYRKNKRFPTTMDELEKFQDVRYLRQRFKDPMTGKDEWRIIHVGPGGQLTDSLVQKQQNPLGPNGGNGTQAANGPAGSSASSGQSSFGSQAASNGPSGGTVQPGFGSSQPNGDAQPPVQYNANGIQIGGGDGSSNGAPPSGINMAVARRRSDQMVLGSQGPPGVNPNLGGNSDPNQPQDPNAQDPNQAQNPVQPGPGPSRYPGQVLPPGLPGQPGFQPGQLPGQLYPGQQQNNPNLPYNPNQGNPGTQQQSSFNNGANTAGNNGGGTGNSSFNTAGAANPALNAIQSSLFSARQPPSNSFGSGNSPGGGVGIAGVATKYKGPSIKIVNERKKYQEWEFVYDMKKDKSLLGAAGVNQLQNAQNPGPGQNAGFSSFGGNSNSTGSSLGANSGSSFGNNNGNSGSAGTSVPPQPQPQQQQQQPPQQ